MKKLNNIFPIAAVAVTSVFGFASCDKDDGFDNQYDNTSLATRSGIQDPNTSDPFRGGVTYHFGEKVMKNIDNYGMAEWTCISDQAPYYFIHVSDKKYSMSEKDDMHYAQSEYAATKEKLEEVGKLMLPHIVQWTPIYGSSGTDIKSYTWIKKDIDKMANNDLSKFIPIVETSTNTQIQINTKEKEGIHITGVSIKCSRSGDVFDVKSEEFWIANSHDYPYADIKWKVNGNKMPASLNIWEHPDNKVVVDDAHHWSYSSPCGGHRFFFIKKVDR